MWSSIDESTHGDDLESHYEYVHEETLVEINLNDTFTTLFFLIILLMLIKRESLIEKN